MPESDDLLRLRKEYAARSRRLEGKDLYSLFNRAYLFGMQQRERDILRLLPQFGLGDLSDKIILEMGCGSGHVLLDLLRYGASSRHLVGVDLLLERLTLAHSALPNATIVNADGQLLPFETGTFDIILQFTAFSSILDSHIKQNIAVELLRLLKPGGIILWYDFWLNPTNAQTRGIRPSEIRALFPDCVCKVQKITLAPPIARRIVPISWCFAQILESLKIFNSHYLAIIKPGSDSD